MLSTTAQPRPDLNMVVQGHACNQSQFVLPRVLPIKDSLKKTGRYWKVKPGTQLRAPTTTRASGASYPRDTYDIEESTFACVNKGLEGQVPFDQAAEFGDIMPLEQARALQKVNQILRREEVDAAGTLFSRTTFPVAAASGHDATNEWDDHANAVPCDDVLTALAAIRGNIGDYASNGLQVCALMNWRTARHAKLCTQVRAGLGGVYTRPEFAAAEIPDVLLAQALGVNEIIIADNRYQTAGTTASPTISNVWDDEYCLIFVRADPNAPEFMGLGVTFVWNEYGGEYEVGTYDEPQTSSRIVQVNRSSVQTIVQSGAGYLIGNMKT